MEKNQIQKRRGVWQKLLPVTVKQRVATAITILLLLYEGVAIVTDSISGLEWVLKHRDWILRTVDSPLFDLATAIAALGLLVWIGFRTIKAEDEKLQKIAQENRKFFSENVKPILEAITANRAYTDASERVRSSEAVLRHLKTRIDEFEQIQRRTEQQKKLLSSDRATLLKRVKDEKVLTQRNASWGKTVTP